jgi:polyisoprenoid-binding protein YceI
MTGTAATRSTLRRSLRAAIVVVAALALGGLCGAVVAAADAPAAAAAQHWSMDPAHSRLTFAAVQAGARFEGRFATFDPQIDFDAAHLSASRFVVTVATGSADTRDKERDETLRGKDFFDATRWPEARFETTAITSSGNGRFEAQGKLTIRDVTRPVRLEFTFTPAADGRTARLTGSTTIQRLDFGVGQGEWADTSWVGNAVDIRFDLALTRAAAASPGGGAAAH